MNTSRASEDKGNLAAPSRRAVASASATYTGRATAGGSISSLDDFDALIEACRPAAPGVRAAPGAARAAALSGSAASTARATGSAATVLVPSPAITAGPAIR